MTHGDLDLEAFCQIEYPRLLRTLRLYVGDEEIARDLAQEALATACSRWRKVRKMDAPGPWVNKVALNLARSYFRRKRAEWRANERVDRGAVEARAPEPELEIVVRDAVAQLPERQKRALILRYFVGMSVSETADAMQCPEGTVKRLSHKAIGNLRDRGFVDLSEEVRDES